MHPDFTLPSPGSIKGRSSSITAAFVQSIIPVREPTEEEVEQALALLGMSRGACRCAYCGSATSEWDHFRPLVVNRRPTGYITEIANLVPACGKCNQSKGNKPWKTWITSNATKSPKTRNVPDLEKKILRLEAYERWKVPTKLDLEQVSTNELWEKHWRNLSRFDELIKECEQHARELRRDVESQLS
ncbi:MAG: HNH endonuclease [Opitutaceae bacterium]|nr:HNH endonuclease [Opitutaceae bacterium]